MSSPPNTGPVNPISPVVVIFFLVMLLLELAFSLGKQGLIGGPEAVGWRIAMVQEYGYRGAYFDHIRETGDWSSRHLLRFFSHLFLHQNFLHMLVGGVMLLALGKFVGEVFAGWAVAVVFLGSGIGGALIWGILLNDTNYLYGAFPGVYGLIGAFSYVLWLRLGQSGDNPWRALTLIGFLIGIQLLFGVLFGARTSWLADIAGFFVGFLLSFVVSPGGWTRLRARLRRD